MHLEVPEHKVNALGDQIEDECRDICGEILNDDPLMGWKRHEKSI